MRPKESSWLSWFFALLLSVLVYFISVMAVFVGPSTKDKIKALLPWWVVDGEPPTHLFPVPTFLRKDGVILRVGGMVTIKNKSKLKYCLKDVFISYNMDEVLVCLVSVTMDEDNSNKGYLGEELMLDAYEVFLAKDSPGPDKQIALEGMNKIQKSIADYPEKIQRAVRRHQLCSGLRRDVQRFLAGFSIAQSWNLGSVNWRFDPGILGLEKDTEFTVDFQIEKYADCVAHMDLLLGDRWDVRRIVGTNGYRAVLTLELYVDTNQDLKAKAHAVLCCEELEPTNHRARTLKSLSASGLNLPGSRSNENTSNKIETSLPLGTAKSLTWEEFMNMEDCNLTSAENSPRSVSAESTSFLNASAAGANLQEIIRKANFNSHNFYYYSPLGNTKKSRPRTGQGSAGRNTSTPQATTEDDLSRSQDGMLMDTEAEVLCLNKPLFRDEQDDGGLVDNTPQTKLLDSSNDTIGSPVIGSIKENMVEERVNLTNEGMGKPRNLNAELLGESGNPTDKGMGEHDSHKDEGMGESDNFKDEGMGESNNFKDEGMGESDNFKDKGIGKHYNLKDEREGEPSNLQEKAAGEFSNKEKMTWAGESVNTEKVTMEPANKENVMGECVNTEKVDFVNKVKMMGECVNTEEVDFVNKEKMMGEPVNKEKMMGECVNTEKVDFVNKEKMTGECVNTAIELNVDESQESSEAAKYLERSLIENNNIYILKVKEKDVCDTEHLSTSPPKEEDLSQAKVAEYINSLRQLDCTPDKLDLSLDSPAPPTKSLLTPLSNKHRRVALEDPVISPLMAKFSELSEGRGRMVSDEEGNTSVCSSRSRTSRVSDLGSMSGRFGKGTLGNFYGGVGEQTNCPFPEEWQYNTIPEVIENDDEID